MNLKNLNVVELNAQEVMETEGGYWWLSILAENLAGNMNFGVGMGNYHG